ncbi:MAG: hypothetical protein JWQ78_2283, partial [Sediminibacterium sp.]|nr:hypothetical protein [Sediminibacterium sp.]
FVQRLQNKFGGTLEEDGKMYISRILASAENMRNLIDNLLEFSRVSRNKHATETTDLSEIVARVVAELDLDIEESGGRVEVGPLPVIEAIPAQMSQLFFNLIVNAIKFRKKDTPPLISITQKELTEEEKQNYQLPIGETYYQVTVKDNGIGFDQVYAERIFQLFQRLQGKHEFPGTGIGLSICKKIVTNHEGLIFASGEPGKGSSFNIILPKQQ